jgi:hypothetical protein
VRKGYYVQDLLTPQVLEWYRGVVDHFEGNRIIKTDTECDVCCPAHPDSNPSLGVDLRINGRGPEILLHCRSRECGRKEILRAVGLTDADRFFETEHEDGALPGCTVAEYATFKGLPEAFLMGDTVGLEESDYWCRVTRRMVPAVRIPYCDEKGYELRACARFRTGLEKTTPDTRMRTTPKSRGGALTLYGRHGTEEARELGYVFVVEGESDCHTLWHYGEPAVGVPGAGNWRPEWAEFLEGIDRVFVFVEDEAGEKLWRAMLECPALDSRVRRVSAR